MTKSSVILSEKSILLNWNTKSAQLRGHAADVATLFCQNQFRSLKAILRSSALLGMMKNLQPERLFVPIWSRLPLLADLAL
jgi:hypothetical protein